MNFHTHRVSETAAVAARRRAGRRRRRIDPAAVIVCEAHRGVLELRIRERMRRNRRVHPGDRFLQDVADRHVRPDGGHQCLVHLHVDAVQLALHDGFPLEAQQILEKGYAAGLLGTGPEAERHKRLKALVDKPASEPKWNGPYLKKEVPLDPWGKAYVYKVPGEKWDFDLVSLGRDGRPGGSGEDADITNH